MRTPRVLPIGVLACHLFAGGLTFLACGCGGDTGSKNNKVIEVDPAKEQDRQKMIEGMPGYGQQKKTTKNQ